MRLKVEVKSSLSALWIPYPKKITKGHLINDFQLIGSWYSNWFFAYKASLKLRWWNPPPINFLPHLIIRCLCDAIKAFCSFLNWPNMEPMIKMLWPWPKTHRSPINNGLIIFSSKHVSKIVTYAWKMGWSMVIEFWISEFLQTNIALRYRHYGWSHLWRPPKKFTIRTFSKGPYK